MVARECPFSHASEVMPPWCFGEDIHVYAIPRTVVPRVGYSSGQNGPGRDLAACTWPNMLMVESDAVSLSRAKNPQVAEGRELKVKKEAMRGEERAAE